jgi:two-component system chemotaxis response regulator CheB
MIPPAPDSLFYPWFKSSQRFDVIALAASAGGFQAFAQLVSGLPQDFTVPIVALLHRGKRPPGGDGLVKFLSRRSRLRVIQATHGQSLLAATIHVAPPGCDLRLYAGQFLTGIPTTKIYPSADSLFGSIAEGYGPRCIGVVLSGALGDGVRGVAAIKARGGTVLVQAPETAIMPHMPKAAIQTGSVDGIMHPADIADALISLTLGRRRRRLASSSIHLGQIAPEQAQLELP